ncbi:MAG: sigma-54-dependent transcriptional regulator [Spirochaetaceae bacterium]
MLRILFIDDDEADHRTLRVVLSDKFEVLSYFRGALAVDCVREVHPDLILLDVDMPDIDGLTVLEGIATLPDPPPVVILSGMRDVTLVVRAMRLGAVDYLVKPFRLLELEQAIRYALVLTAARRPRRLEEEQLGEVSLLGNSRAVRILRKRIRRFGASDLPVLIFGESGTGKDLVARGIHAVSPRSDGPFVAINCAAIPQSIFESEMFGAERGAYTDAVPHPGRFEVADGGTIFLDEVAEMDAQNQAKVLRAVEDQSIRRVGGNRPRRIDVRIVSATNRPSGSLVASGSFRSDLYYRLSTLIIEVPALRDREEDIALLATHFLRMRSRGAKRLSAGALERLESHSWPGNVRELKNCVDRGMLLTEGQTINAEDIVFY